MNLYNYDSGPVRYYERPQAKCTGPPAGPRCRNKATFDSGRCGACEDAFSRKDFAVLDSYLKEEKP